MQDIAGIISAEVSVADAAPRVHRLVQAMVQAMLPRHTRDHGAHATRTTDQLALPAMNACVGWSLRADGTAPYAPVWNDTHDVVLFQSGEAMVDTKGLTLLHLYASDGTAGLARLSGSFAGLIVDLRQRAGFLFNDRLGLHRMHVHATPRAFYFATQAKALLAVLPQTRALDNLALAHLHTVGCVMGTQTLFKGIECLPPSAVWTLLPQARVQRLAYFSPSTWEQQALLSPQDFDDKLRAVMAQVMPRYFQGPLLDAPHDTPQGAQKVGMSLTGGLDGRMVLAWSRQAKGTLPCYTFGGTVRDCADVRLARQIAQLRGQSHQTIEIGADFLRQFTSLAAQAVHASDGTMDVTGGVEWYANAAAKRIAPVRMTGNYGSEIMRGNVAFKPNALATAWVAPEQRLLLEEARQTYLDARRCHDLSFIAFRQVPWHHQARYAVERSQLTVRSPFLDPSLVGLMYQAPLTARTGYRNALQLVHDGDASLSSIPTDRGLLHAASDRRNAWQQGVKNFSAKVEYAFDYGMPPWLVKTTRALAPLGLERHFLGHHKFYHFRRWYRDALAQDVQALLLNNTALGRTYYRRDAVQTMVREHVDGRANHTLALHRALSHELVHQQLLNGWGNTQQHTSPIVGLVSSHVASPAAAYIAPTRVQPSVG
jgi:asparagine synthase (glutamine-hydrolysing)